MSSVSVLRALGRRRPAVLVPLAVLRMGVLRALMVFRIVPGERILLLLRAGLAASERRLFVVEVAEFLQGLEEVQLILRGLAVGLLFLVPTAF